MRITVGLPVYNGADYLAQALDSVLSQVAVEFELLVSEGGSTDETPSILRAYAARDPRVRYLPTPTRLSQAENCNRVLKLAQTEWVQFMCHDDIMLPGALQRIVQAINNCPATVSLLGHAPANLLGGRFVHDSSVAGGRLIPWSKGDEIFSVTELHPQVRIISSGSCSSAILSMSSGPVLPALTTAAVRRTALLGIGGFDSKYAQFDSYAWNLLLLRRDYAYLPEPLTLTRIHGRQVTAKLKNQLRTTEDALLFWPQYIAEARSLGVSIPTSAHWLPWLKASSQASAQLYVSLLKGQVGGAARMFLRLPWRVMLMLPAFLLRTWRAERCRTGFLRPHLSFEEIYP